MRIQQVLPARPTEYQKKCQRIDLALLREAALTGEVTLIYGKPPVSDLPEAVEDFDGAAGFNPPNRGEPLENFRGAGFSPANRREEDLGGDRRPEGRRYTIASYR